MNVVLQQINPPWLFRGPMECTYSVDQHLMNRAQPVAKVCPQRLTGSNTQPLILSG